MNRIYYCLYKQADAVGNWSMPIGRNWNPYMADAFSGLGADVAPGAGGGGGVLGSIGSFFKNIKGKGKLALYGGLGVTGVVGLGALIRSMNNKRRQQKQQYNVMGR